MWHTSRGAKKSAQAAQWPCELTANNKQHQTLETLEQIVDKLLKFQDLTGCRMSVSFLFEMFPLRGPLPYDSHAILESPLPTVGIR